MVEVQTTRFGGIRVEEGEIITMVEPILGFPWSKRYVLRKHKPGVPFKWFQSVDDGALAFVVIDPLIFKPDYVVELDPETAMSLEIEKPEDAEVYVIVTIPPNNPKEMTANLRAPLVINKVKRLAKQVILDVEDYPIKYKILDS
ncbi:MAG: flagellar assembly protein FliW [Thermosulfidibacteraceae bacterium]|jgi:flagellar assembly factor FliW